MNSETKLKTWRHPPREGDFQRIYTCIHDHTEKNKSNNWDQTVTFHYFIFIRSL